MGTIAPEPGRTPSGSPAWARMSGSRVEANIQWGVSMKISAALKRRHQGSADRKSRAARKQRLSKIKQQQRAATRPRE